MCKLYLRWIRHGTVGQWSMLSGLISSGSVYCVARAGQKNVKISQFRPTFHILWRILWPSHYTIQANFGKRQQTHRLHLHTIFHLNLFIVSPSRNEKPQFWANVDTCGLLYPAVPAPIYRWGPNFTSILTVYTHVPYFVSISLFCHLGGENPQFCRCPDYGILWCCQLVAYGKS